jgi:hypothetical protein
MYVPAVFELLHSRLYQYSMDHLLRVTSVLAAVAGTRLKYHLLSPVELYHYIPMDWIAYHYC